MTAQDLRSFMVAPLPYNENVKKTITTGPKAYEQRNGKELDTVYTALADLKSVKGKRHSTWQMEQDSDEDTESVGSCTEQRTETHEDLEVASDIEEDDCEDSTAQDYSAVNDEVETASSTSRGSSQFCSQIKRVTKHHRKKAKVESDYVEDFW